jgi:hypothetical protein
VLAPVEFAAVDDHAADGGAVAPNPFCGGVHDDVGAVVDGAAVVAASAEGVVDDDGDAGFVGDCDDFGKVRDVVFGVANAFKLDSVRPFHALPRGSKTHVNSLGLVVNHTLEVFWLVSVHKFGRNTHTRKHNLELVVCASIQIRGRDDVVARMCESCDGNELRSLARRCC